MKNPFISPAIQSDLLLSEYSKLIKKLARIDKIPRLNGNGKDFKRLDIDSKGVTYRTTTTGFWGKVIEYSFFVSWDEINNPIKYFEANFKAEINSTHLENLRKINEWNSFKNKLQNI